MDCGNGRNAQINLMEIKIKFESSYQAFIEIDGKKMEYNLIGKNTGLSGISEEDFETTLGGMVALKFCTILPTILQGWMPDEPNPQGDSWETWEKLTDSAADEIFKHISPYS